MKWIVLVSALVVAVVVGGYFAWTWMLPTGSLRYRMTVDVDVDGDIRSGSTVVEVRFARQGWSDEASLGVTSSVRGEAVAVDLGVRGILFVVLTGPRSGTAGGYVADPPAMVVREFRLAPSVGSLKGKQLSGLSRIAAHAEIPSSRLPLLVRFRDLNDPKTVEQVNPDDLAASFGPGARLLRARIESTRDQVTTGIGSRLPWLRQQRGSLIKDLRLPYDHYARQITEGSFSIGVQ